MPPAEDDGQPSPGLNPDPGAAPDRARPTGADPGEETGDLAAVDGTELPPPLEPGVTATYAWTPLTATTPDPTETTLPEPALAGTALAEPTASEIAASRPTVSETALSGTTLSEDAVTGPPVPDTDPAPLASERVSLVKARPTISHPRVGIDDVDPGSVAAPEPPPSTPSAHPAPRGDPRLRFISQTLTIVAVLALGMLTQLTLLGGLQHDRDQAQAFSELRIELADGTAPVGPLGEDGKPLPAGTPVAILEIPTLGLSEVILEGSTSRVTMSGPGHRRDTVLPGQAGTSIVLGRRGGYSGPFGEIDKLRPDDEIIVTTGQGRHTFAVLGVRRAGDPLPARLERGQGRLTLTTTDGPALQPRDALRVDADLASPAQLSPAQIPASALPENEAVLAGDSSALLSLMLWGPLLLVAAAGVVWVRYRAGRWQSWIIGIPVLGLLGVIVIDIAIALLPNVL